MTPPASIRIVLADDHKLLRRLLTTLINGEPDMSVVGEADDGEEAYKATVALHPDVLLLDLYMPRTGGLEVLRRIRTDVPETMVVVLSSSASAEDITAAFHEGAQGYLLKTMEPEKLCARLREAVSGEIPIAAEVAKLLLGRAVEAAGKPENLDGQLTPREIEVVTLIAGGASNREIGTQLLLSENTVKNHIRRILEKLHMHNRAQIAASWAAHNGRT